ncbi:hypothetical protein EJ08DRAFT_701112 [Tothia fuscella]|uniref:DUF7908 domain-containing protein n=1 Tax=Tothia fuscella TaxID=1048955 RepID=A0A9P4NJG5_9PEZI|nr:hypothetical protein EJ08DRAFT_701112 [Tothia fuscella]
MKYSIASILTFGAVVSALPAAAPSKFALEITAKMGQAGQKTLYLAKGATGASTADKAQAESCSINEQTQLVCGGKTMGVATSRTSTDMAAIAASTDVTKGFSVDANNVLHWKTQDLNKLPAFTKAVKEDPQYKDGEAKFGLFTPLSGMNTQLYFQLGCPGQPASGDMPHTGTHGGLHNAVYEGVAKAVAM